MTLKQSMKGCVNLISPFYICQKALPYADPSDWKAWRKAERRPDQSLVENDLE